MCCNTAHYAVDEIAEQSGLKFINLLEGVATKVAHLGHGKVMMFCSDGARKFDIYGDVFRRVCPEIELVYPTEPDQQSVTEVICGVKTKTRFEAKPKRMLLDLIARQEIPIVLGCTDLRVAFDVGETLPNFVVVDSLETLADEIVKRHHGIWRSAK